MTTWHERPSATATCGYKLATVLFLRALCRKKCGLGRYPALTRSPPAAPIHTRQFFSKARHIAVDSLFHCAKGKRIGPATRRLDDRQTSSTLALASIATVCSAALAALSEARPRRISMHVANGPTHANSGRGKKLKRHFLRLPNARG